MGTMARLQSSFHTACRSQVNRREPTRIKQGTLNVSPVRSKLVAIQPSVQSPFVDKHSDRKRLASMVLPAPGGPPLTIRVLWPIEPPVPGR